MIQHAQAPIDRPPPGHYRVRVSAVLSDLPVADPRPSWQRPVESRRLVVRPKRRRTGQLALPLEDGASGLRGRR
jgi:hypothetical protein